MAFKQKVSFDCDRSNFSKCDRCILNVLRLYLARADKHNSTSSQSQQILTQFKQILARAGAIGLTPDGQIQFATQRAEQLLNQYFLTCSPHALPELLQHWFTHQISQLSGDNNLPSPCRSLHIEQAEQQLVIRLLPERVGEQYFLLLEEQEAQSFSIASLELLGLTQREAEVLFWVAKDKSNAAIAKALDCCEGTVRKHLENLYKKLGVQTRTGAVMVALERLGLLQEQFVAMLS